MYQAAKASKPAHTLTEANWATGARAAAIRKPLAPRMKSFHAVLKRRPQGAGSDTARSRPLPTPWRAHSGSFALVVLSAQRSRLLGATNPPRAASFAMTCYIHVVRRGVGASTRAGRSSKPKHWADVRAASFLGSQPRAHLPLPPAPPAAGSGISRAGGQLSGAGGGSRVRASRGLAAVCDATT